MQVIKYEAVLQTPDEDIVDNLEPQILYDCSNKTRKVTKSLMPSLSFFGIFELKLPVNKTASSETLDIESQSNNVESNDLPSNDHNQEAMVDIVAETPV